MDQTPQTEEGALLANVNRGLVPNEQLPGRHRTVARWVATVYPEMGNGGVGIALEDVFHQYHLREHVSVARPTRNDYARAFAHQEPPPRLQRGMNGNKRAPWRPSTSLTWTPWPPSTRSWFQFERFVKYAHRLNPSCTAWSPTRDMNSWNRPIMQSLSGGALLPNGNSHVVVRGCGREPLVPGHEWRDTGGRPRIVAAWGGRRMYLWREAKCRVRKERGKLPGKFEGGRPRSQPWAEDPTV